MAGGRLEQKIAGFIYLMTGLVRLHGVEKDSKLNERVFAIAVVLATLLSLLMLHSPVPQALSATFFLVMQVLSILRTYEKNDKTVRDGIIWVVLCVAVSVLLYLSTTSYETHHPSVIDLVMAENVTSEVEEDLEH